jgi:hypothetical protein
MPSYRSLLFLALASFAMNPVLGLLADEAATEVTKPLYSILHLG